MMMGRWLPLLSLLLVNAASGQHDTTTSTASDQHHTTSTSFGQHLTTSNLVQNSTFVGNSVYEEWLEDASYDNAIFIPSDNQVNGVAVHWTLSEDTSMLSLAVAVEASDWVGFGLSENGGMTGSDMMIYEVANPEVVLDAYVTSERHPFPDDCQQDWNLVGATIENGTMIVEVTRKLVTGETQDLAILDDSSLGFPVHRIISAWGDEEAYTYHGMNRARGTIRWFDKGMAETERFMTTMEPYENNTFSILANDYPIKPIETEYAYSCITGNDLRSQGVDLDAGVTMVGIEPHVTTSHVHHFIAYASYSENNDGAVNCSDVDNYIQISYLWAPGEPPFVFPDNLGMAIGGDTGYRSFRIEYHYDNPDLVEDAVDNSGLIYYYSPEPREHNVGIMQVGDPFLGLYGYPIADGTTSYQFDCPSSCTNVVLDEPVTVFREYLHMHQSGVFTRNDHFRNDQWIRSATADFYDFNQQGAQAVLQEPYQVQPGDSFRMQCYYENAEGTSRTFGLGSSEEMCIAYLFYYPAKLTADGLPMVCGVGVDAFLSECGIPANGVSMEENSSNVLTAERVFGTATGQCSAESTDGEGTSSAMKNTANSAFVGTLIITVVAAATDLLFL